MSIAKTLPKNYQPEFHHCIVSTGGRILTFKFHTKKDPASFYSSLYSSLKNLPWDLLDLEVMATNNEKGKHPVSVIIYDSKKNVLKEWYQ